MCPLEHSWRAAGCLCLDNDLYVFCCEQRFPSPITAFPGYTKKSCLCTVFSNIGLGFFPSCFPLPPFELIPITFPISHPLQPPFLAPHSPLVPPLSTQSSALLCAIGWFSFQQVSRNIWNLILSCKTLPRATPAQPSASSLLVPLQTRPGQSPDSDTAEQDVLIRSTLTLKGFGPHHSHPCYCSEHQAHHTQIPRI